MFDDLPRHAGYVIVAYAIVAVAIAGLIAWIVHARRVQTRMLEKLERRARGDDLPLESQTHD